MANNITIPLVAPDFNLLRADAVWVTIANWSEGLAERYGSSAVIAGNRIYSTAQIRAKCFSSPSVNNVKRQPSKFRKSYFGKLLETFAKDLRWLYEDKKPLGLDIYNYKDVPFVWQHHDLFQTRGLKMAKTLNVPSVLFVDAPYVWESGKWGTPRLGWKWISKYWGDALPCRKADLVLVVSEEVKHAVIDLGVDESKILVTPCTVSPSKFNSEEGYKSRESLGLTDDFIIGWVGSFRKFHCLDLLVEAFSKISASLPSAKLLLVGDGPERIQLQEKVVSLVLNSRVIFTGNVPHNQVHTFISSFDLAVLPSESNEGFHYSPLKLREFFAAGVPVVASSLGDVKNVIEKSNGGWLVPPGSAKSIADMILTLEKDSIKAKAINARNYARAEMGIMNQILMIENYFGIKKSH